MSYEPAGPVLAAAPTTHLSMAVADAAPPNADVLDTVEILKEKENQHG